MLISVIGIGYVGAVTSACLCETGHNVIAIDNDHNRVACLNRGHAPIIEKGLEGLIHKHINSGVLKASSDIKDAVLNTDVSLICVGTPSHADGSLDLNYVKDVCAEIGQALKEKSDYHTIVLRSTMVPGSAIDICLPIIEETSGKKVRIGFGFGNNPEFLREGSAIYDYYNPPKIVVGGIDDKSADSIMSLYDGIDAPRIKTDMNIAEGVKYADNAWHAMKVGFANEIGNILNECGIDSHKVMDIFCMDRKLNISEAYLKPGFAFGGSCLPKDVRAIRAKGQEKGLNTPLFDALLEANQNQVMRAYRQIKSSNAQHIAMLGLSFKAGTDDIRESPLVTLADQLLNDGYQVSIYDPNVFAANSNTPSSHLSVNMVENPNGLKGAEMFIIGNSNPDFIRIIEAVENDNTPILDLVRLDKALEKREGYRGICW